MQVPCVQATDKSNETQWNRPHEVLPIQHRSTTQGITPTEATQRKTDAGARGRSPQNVGSGGRSGRPAVWSQADKASPPWDIQLRKHFSSFSGVISEISHNIDRIL